MNSADKTKFCIECGKKNEYTAKFCTHCGTSQSQNIKTQKNFILIFSICFIIGGGVSLNKFIFPKAENNIIYEDYKSNKNIIQTNMIQDEMIQDEIVQEDEVLTQEIQRTQLNINKIITSENYSTGEYTNYITENTTDNNINTSWVIKNNTYDRNWIEYQFESTQQVEEIQIYNGSGDTNNQNDFGYANIIEISFSNGEYFCYPVNKGWNTLVLPHCVESSSLRVTIIDNYSTTLCISEVLIFNKYDNENIIYNSEHSIIELPVVINTPGLQENTVSPFAIINGIEVYRIEDLSEGDIINGFKVTEIMIDEELMTIDVYSDNCILEPLEDLFIEINSISIGKGVYIHDYKYTNYNNNNFIVTRLNNFEFNLDNSKQYILNDINSGIQISDYLYNILIKDATNVDFETYILNNTKTIKIDSISEGVHTCGSSNFIYGEVIN